MFCIAYIVKVIFVTTYFLCFSTFLVNKYDQYNTKSALKSIFQFINDHESENETHGERLETRGDPR